jgi:hypothetical protein
MNSVFMSFAFLLSVRLHVARNNVRHDTDRASVAF